MAFILIALATLLWGVWAIFEKNMAVSGNLYWVNAYYVFAEASLLPFYLWAAVRFGGVFSFSVTTLSWAYAAVFASSGATLITLYLLTKFSVGWVAAFTAAYPVVTLLIGVLFLKEQLSWTSIVGVCLVAAGLVFLSLE